jgi:ribosomal protein L11 methyltransferase
MNYIELKITTSADWADILIAELGEIGYESFTEDSPQPPEEAIFNAYITEDLFSEEAVNEIVGKYKEVADIAFEYKVLPKQNWNETWEQSYEAIEVEGKCRVRASFHEPNPAFAYEIVINPKMSFGTGHHETTSMMLAHQLVINQENLRVLDVGCGTGILAIMAAKRGAKYVSAFDIEEWAAENSRENTMLNHCEDTVVVRQGTIEDEPKVKYDIVLANINRNILLRDIPTYTQFMEAKCTLVVSGFYEQDVADIEAVAKENGLVKTAMKTKNNWAAVVFSKIVEC